MNGAYLPEYQRLRDKELKNEIATLTSELASVEQKTLQFEAMLRSELASMLIQVQELTVLYKQQKQAKKAQRLEQKKRGKHYKAPEGIKRVATETTAETNPDDQQELKRLYREAMLHVHPDKFSMNEGQQELATEVTAQLIEIYNSGNLSTLRSYHAHIFSGSVLEGVVNTDLINANRPLKDNYLQKEKERIEKALSEAKDRQTYKVLISYDDPMRFLEELRVYYRDRIYKLKKRTRS